MTRTILLVVHHRRAEARHLARSLCEHLRAAGIVPRLSSADREVLGGELGDLVEWNDGDCAEGCELVCVLGGDGTILRGAELARGCGIPVLGVNLGHVGFLAEAEREHFEDVVERIVLRDYAVEERLTLEVVVHQGDDELTRTWALNEATVEKASRQRMLELAVGIDGRPLSTWGCDGVVMATPTGSTAYAFSAGGPVVWPTVEALLVVPLSAHALFARPLVLSPSSEVSVELLPDQEGTGVLWCDGRRTIDLPRGARVEARRSDVPVRLARLVTAPFTDRLVAKFDLSIAGWRGRGRLEP
ncbi:NAD kinase [Arsenicicoccus sp. oral taxon 190]|uniref:NAD kinase n=1 Tax=Arsenicicoccus sp. oral taxon 190 TaxID=1658671 RepID=UPI00067A3017|nr:NAD kinase [Arsenicicoccus sp. oral taxon 190]AKT51681.1 inorganic polyphosphate kinase [Arsenicicoccus sp. oral taxon 190]